MATQEPERPLECSECQRPCKVIYTEIVGSEITRTAMCNSCPELQHKLQGEVLRGEGEDVEGKEGTGLCCGDCGTTLESVRMGHPVGCSHCYEVFGDVLVLELISHRKGKDLQASGGRSVPLHIGRSPGEKAEISPSVRLIALNEALHDTLSKEDYEQAAWLRDQIKAITEETGEEIDEQSQE